MSHKAIFFSKKRVVIISLLTIIVFSVVIRFFSYIIDPISPRDSFLYYFFVEEMNCHGYYSLDFISEFSETQWVSPLYIYLCHKLSSFFCIPVKTSCIAMSIVTTSFAAIPIFYLSNLLFRNNITALFAALISVIHPSSVSIGYMPLRDSLNFFLIATLLFFLFDSIFHKTVLSSFFSGITLSLCVLCRFENIDFLVYFSFVYLLELIYKRNRMWNLSRLAIIYTSFIATFLFFAYIVNSKIFQIRFIINSIARYI